MKALLYIGILTALLASSCATGRINTGGETDDLYYSSSDKPAVTNNSKPKTKDASASTQPDQYYDNIYAQDTLIADGYNDAVDFQGSNFYQDDNNAFEYMDDPFSYSHRLSMFYGNYFYPYWRTPYYYGYNPYYYDYYNPYYPSYGYNPYFYGGYYGGFYGGYYGGFYGGMGLSFGFGTGYYGGSGYYAPYYNTSYPNENVSVGTGRRERYSSLTSSYNNTVPPVRKSTYNPAVTEGASRRSQTAVQSATGSEYRRTGTTTDITQGRTTESGNRSQSSAARRDVSEMTQPSTRPGYNSSERSYTPSYNNPRMSERPSYNNSRMSGSNSQGVYQSNPRSSSTINSYRPNSEGNSNTSRSSSSFSTGQLRSGSINSGNSGSYSVPSRREFSGGNSNVSGTRSYDGGGYSGSSVRSGGGSSSYSGGGSSGGSSSSGGGGGDGGRSSGTASGSRR